MFYSILYLFITLFLGIVAYAFYDGFVKSQEREEDLDEIEKILFPKRDKPTSTEPEEKPKQKKIKL